MAKKFVLNRPAVSDLMKSDKVRSVLERQADIIMQGLPSGYEMETDDTDQRARILIRAVSHDAQKDNLENNTLLKAIGK